MAFQLQTELSTGVSGNYWYLGFVQVLCNDQPYCIVSMDLYLDRQAKLDGKAIMERRNTNMLLSEIDASVSYDFRVCIYTALHQKPEWQSAVVVYDDPTQNPKCQDNAVTTEMETPVDITISAYDPYNVPFTLSIVDQPDNGTVQQNLTQVQFGGGTLSVPVFTYTPNPGFGGLDSFTYTATNDNGIVGNTATISVTVPSRVPLANSFSTTTAINTPIDITLSGADPQNLPLTYNITTNPSHGTLVENSGVYTYTPDNDFEGVDSFNYNVYNGTYTSETATVTITI